jgi:hypothetical protein
MADDLIYSEPVYTERADTAIAAPASANGQETDWSGWEKWLRGHLDIEKESIFETIIETVGDLEAQRDRQIRTLELKLAELTGTVSVLRSGRAMRVRGTFDEAARYEQLDVVAVNGSSFVATRDNPGRCPGEHWQLLASAGSRGARGFPGPRGERGERGEPAPAGATFKMFHLDPKDYTLSAIMSDGKMHSVSLRKLFEQFVNDVQGRR